jgi:hypothetical protein
MKVIDSILQEWSYRCHDGIVDLNNPEKVKILAEILKPLLTEDIDDDILDALSKLNSNDPKKEKVLNYLQKIDKEESGEEIQQFKKEDPKLYKIFINTISPSLIEKNLDKKIINHILGEFLAEDKEEYLIKYFNKPPEFNIENIKEIGSIKNPVYNHFKEVGCEDCQQIIEKLYPTLAGATKVRGVGKEENFLVAFYNNVKKRDKAGDLNIDDKKYEIKGDKSVVSPHGYGSKKDAFLILNRLIYNIGKKFPDIYKDYEATIQNIKEEKIKWVSSVTNLGNNLFKNNIQEYLNILKDSLEGVYTGINIDDILNNGEIDANLLAIRIAQNCIDEASLEKDEQFLFVSEEGEIKVISNKDELKKLINNGINIAAFSDLSPRLTYKGTNSFTKKEISKIIEPKVPKQKEKIEILKKYIETSESNRQFVSEEWINRESNKKYKNQFDCTQKYKNFCLLKLDATIEFTPKDNIEENNSFISELANTDHFQLRLGERGNVLDILNLKEIPLKDYNSSEVKEKLKSNISEELKARATNILSKDIPTSNTYDIGIKILKPVLVVDNKKYPLKLFAISTKEIKDKEGNVVETVEVENKGTLYFATVADNKATTLMLLDKEDDNELYFQIKDHASKKKGEGREAKILAPPNYIYEIDLDELMGNKIDQGPTLVDPDTLDYELKAAYKPKSKFVSKSKGEGTIIAASVSGQRSGEPDGNGVVDWVEVEYKFDKPKLKSGKLVYSDIVKYNPVFTTSYKNLKK